MSPTLEQFQGCILGLAVADALGAPWEGVPAGMIFEMGPPDKIVLHESNEPIYYTDDTQMTIGVVQTLLDLGEIQIEVLANRFATNYHPDRGYGQGARQIINAIGSGEDWKALTRSIFKGEGSLGNGAAMRVSPVGICFANDLQKVAAQAELSALSTHQHPIGIDAARIMAVATALAATGTGARFDRSAFLTTLLSFAGTDEFRWQLEHALQLEPFQSLIGFGNSLEAHRSVTTSILCFADSPDDYSQAIARAIGQGNDVDTLAAMAGTLAGARLGIGAIPTNLLNCLEDSPQGKTFLLDLTRQLFEAYRESD